MTPRLFNAKRKLKQSMFKYKLLIGTAAACIGLPLSAGTILNTYPDGPSAYSNGYLLQAQTFTVGADTVLDSVKFQLFNATGQFVQFEVYAWGASGPTGPVLFDSTNYPRINAIQDFTVTGMNLTLTQGSVYGVVVDPDGYSSFDAAFNTNQTSYTGGHMWLLSQDTPTVWSSFSGDNLLFQASFISGATPPTTSGVPEPAAFVLMGGGLAIVGLLKFRSGNSVRPK
jgi:hypothetical protein